MVNTRLAIVYGSYFALICLLGLIGYYAGKKSDRSILYSNIGALIGVMLSTVLWFVEGRTYLDD